MRWLCGLVALVLACHAAPQPKVFDVERGQLPVHVLSQTTTNRNPTPPFVPPALHAAWLHPTPDGLHYNVKVKVGSPPQELSLVLDTGSRIMYVFSRTYCAKSNSAGASAPGQCFERNDSTSLQAVVPTQLVLSYRYDDTFLRDDGALSYRDEMTMDVFEAAGPRTLSSPAPKALKLSIANELTFTPASPSDRMHTLNYSDGVLGAAFQLSATEQPLSSAFLALMQNWPTELLQPNSLTPIFSLEFPSTVAVSSTSIPAASGLGTLYIGGIRESYRSNLVWSQRSSFESLFKFPVYQMSVCGSPLVAGSSSVIAEVNTGASCLTLPAESFDSLMTWIPVECTDTFACYLPSTVSTILPALSFRLAQDGTILHLPLSDLLYAEGSKKRYCIRRGAALRNNYLGNTMIVFGTKTLHSLYAVFNMPTAQVAFANKASISNVNIQCRVTKRCIGMQTRDITSNTCVDPDCSAYNYFELDESSKECKLSAGFHTLAAVFITLLVFSEVFLNELYHFLSVKVSRDVAPP